MRTITTTELARNLHRILDSVEFRGEKVTVVRNKRATARILPVAPRMTALEAMSDLYRTLPESAAAGWLEDSRTSG